MQVFEAVGSFVGQLDSKQLLLAVEIVFLLTMIAANSRATALLYASQTTKRGRRIWLAAIWGLPMAGLAYLLVRALGRLERFCVGRSQAQNAKN